MSEFFLPPYEPGDPAGEKALDGIIRWAEETTGWQVDRDVRIARLDYAHEGKMGVIEVGGSEPRTGEPVIAILASDTYLVCTPSRGVLRGEPVLVGRDEVLQVVTFD